MADVFISYSRKDETFVRQLHAALAKAQRNVWVDWEDIPPTADWWREIQTGIEGADTFVFVISPDSARSEVCYNEVDYAYKNHKRIVPVVCRNPSREEQEKLHTAVNRHNWVFFNQDGQFEQDFQTLLSALDTDLSYVRDHTRLLVRAKEWESRGRDGSYLLRGSDLQDAENLLVQSAQHPDLRPTDLQTAYIYASRGAATRRQRITLGSVIFALVLSIALAIFGLVSSQQAQENLRLSRQTQSLFLAELSRQQQESEHYRSALLLALEAVQYFPTIQNGESLRALLNSLSGPQQELIALPHQAESETGLATVTGVRWSQDESRILSVFGNNVLIWDSSSGDIVLTLQHDDTARGGLWNQDNTRILTWSADGTARVWDPFIENQLLTLVHDAPVSGALWIPEQGRIVTWVEGPDVHIWDANTGDELLTLNYGGSSQVGDVQLRGNNLLVRVGSALHLWTLADGSDGIETTQHLRMDHGAAVRGMAWNPAGDRILSWSDDQTVRIWNAADGQQLERQNHSEAVEGAIWSPDGQSVLYWSRNVPPVLWDFASQQTCSIGSADNTVQGAAWAVDSAHFATWTRSGALSIWTVPDPMSVDACANAVPQTLNFDRAVEGARWSADGSRILAWSQDGTARIWTPGTGDMLVFDHNGSPVRDAVWSKDESQVLTTSLDNVVHVWTTVSHSGTRVVLDMPHDRPVAGAAWNPDQTLILSWTSGPDARLWTADGTAHGAVMTHPDTVNGGVWKGDGSQILTWTRGGGVFLWDSDGKLISDAMRHADSVAGAAWNPDSTRILSWAADGRACIWTAYGQPDVPCMTHDSAVVGAAWSQDGARVLTWSRDKRACIWDASSGQIAAGTACMLHSEAVLGAAWNPDETRVLTWTRDNFLRIWDDSGNLLHEIEHPRTVQGARWSPNGTEILSWAGGDSVLVWNAETGEQIADLPHGTSIQGVKGAVWNHDGSRILSWSSNGVVRIWALPGHGTALADDESPLRATMNHSRIVSGAMWNQDETRVLSWSSDDTARIWDVSIDNDPEELFVLEHSDAVGGALWNTAETRVLTWSRSSLREWVVDVDTLISTARSRFVQPFSNEERERFFLPTLAPTPIAPTPTKYG